MLKRLLLLVIKAQAFDDVLRVVIGVDGASDYKRSVIDSEFAKWAAGSILVRARLSKKNSSSS
jgi:hypothetical protein